MTKSRRYGAIVLATLSTLFLANGSSTGPCGNKVFIDGNVGDVGTDTGQKIHGWACVEASDRAGNYKIRMADEGGKEYFVAQNHLWDDDPDKHPEIRKAREDITLVDRLGDQTAKDGKVCAPKGSTESGIYPIHDDGRSPADDGNKKGISNSTPISLNTLAPAIEAARAEDDLAAHRLVDDGRKKLDAIAASAKADQEVVAEPYTHMDRKALGESFARAERDLGNAITDLDATARSNDLPDGERARFRNLFLNARDKAALGRAALDDGTTPMTLPNPLGALLPAGGLAAGGAASGLLAAIPGLENIFGMSPDSAEGKPGLTPPGAKSADGRAIAAAASAGPATTNDALVNRTMMFMGLPAAARTKAMEQLKLLEHPRLTLANGQTREIPLLHNGYLLGGKGTATDCSAFISEILPAEARKARFTTLDFRNMWLYRSFGKFPKPPKYPAGREDIVKNVADGFRAIDVYRGQSLQEGDLLVYRLLWESYGHVFLVRGYDPGRLEAQVLEASQSAGTIRERSFALSLDPSASKPRYIRPGLFVLRMKTQENKFCRMAGPTTAPFETGKDRAPAASTPATPSTMDYHGGAR